MVMSNITKKPTLSKRMDNLEKQIESMLEHQISSLDRLSESRQLSQVALDNMLEKVSSFIDSDEQKSPSNVATAQEVKPQPAFYNYQTSASSNTVVEKLETQPIGCFEILESLVEQFGTGKNGVSVSAPYINKESGQPNKSFILNLPRIDETFKMVDKEKSLADQKKQAIELWKTVVMRNKFIFAKRSLNGWVNYIKMSGEEDMVKFLKGIGIHIPQKDHRLKEVEEESS
jgi:hypothetical protein